MKKSHGSVELLFLVPRYVAAIEQRVPVGAACAWRESFARQIGGWGIALAFQTVTSTPIILRSLPHCGHAGVGAFAHRRSVAGIDLRQSMIIRSDSIQTGRV